MIDCNEFQDNLDEYIDGSLLPEKMVEFRMHEESCETCRMEVAYIRDAAAIAREIEIREPEKDYWESFKNKNVRREIVMGGKKDRLATGRYVALALVIAAILFVILCVLLFSPALNAPHE